MVEGLEDIALTLRLALWNLFSIVQGVIATMRTLLSNINFVDCHSSQYFNENTGQKRYVRIDTVPQFVFIQ